jgi:hypothetical protein
VPAATVVGGLPEIVSGATTLIAKGASVAVVLVSLTLIWMFAKVPMLVLVGVPLNCPVLLLKFAQAGLFAIVKVRGSWSGSEAVGVNVKLSPATTFVAGVPDITGGEFEVCVPPLPAATPLVVDGAPAPPEPQAMTVSATAPIRPTRPVRRRTSESQQATVKSRISAFRGYKG